MKCCRRFVALSLIACLLMASCASADSARTKEPVKTTTAVAMESVGVEAAYEGREEKAEEPVLIDHTKEKTPVTSELSDVSDKTTGTELEEVKVNNVIVDKEMNSVVQEESAAVEEVSSTVPAASVVTEVATVVEEAVPVVENPYASEPQSAFEASTAEEVHAEAAVSFADRIRAVQPGTMMLIIVAAVFVVACISGFIGRACRKRKNHER